MAEPLNRSLARGLDMLALLGDAPKGLALHEIARAMDAPKSSAYNLLQTLLAKGFVRYDPDTEHYVLTTRTLEVGVSALKGVTAESLLRQHMTEIYEACNETVHCGVPDGTDVVYIDKIESTHSIRMTSRIGSRLPLSCTAMGRAILATMPDTAVEALLRDVPFAAYTAHTLCSWPALEAELAKVRTQGYATEREETNENVCCMGVAIRNRQGVAQYAISISAPIFRMDAAQQARCAGLLLRAQGRLERAFQQL